MKKSSFAALLPGTVSGLLFALGMCMALIPDWNMLRPGAALGCAGAVLGLVTVVVWRRMEHRPPVRLSLRAAGIAAAAAAGVLAFGAGMCLCMVWGRMLPGIAAGCAGILILVLLVPAVRGLRD